MDMKSLRYTISAWILVTGAALFGASCASSERPANGGGDTTDPAGGEQTGESQDPSRAATYAAPAPPPGSVTSSCAGFWNGVWCGGNQGFPGSTSALYYCYNGRSLLIQVCPGSCQGQPIGVEDHC
jgi:hypothetical protein